MKILKIVFALVILTAAFFTGNYLFFGMFLFGAVVTGNVLGKVSGKLGQIVGFAWKGIDVFRSYVIPANPQTTEQMLHRNNFKGIVSFSSYWLTSIIQPYWKAFAIKMSEFNAFVKENSGILDFENNIDDVVMAKGPLFNGGITSVVADNSDNSVKVDWETDKGADGEPTDKAVICVYYPKTNAVIVDDASATRETGTKTISVPDIAIGESVYTWLFFYRENEDKSLRVSNSDVLKVTAQA